MTEQERLEMGRREHRARMADIARVKTGEMALADAQAAARNRAAASGISEMSYQAAMVDALRLMRASV